MTQSIPLAALSGRVPSTDNSNQGSDETKRGTDRLVAASPSHLAPEQGPEYGGNSEEHCVARAQLVESLFQWMCGVNKKYKVSILILSTVLIIAIIVNIVVPIVTVRPPLVTWYFCPDDWIRFQDDCYYFSKQEENWNSSRYNCSTQHADLTTIDTMEEMNFLTQHKCTSDHWIGLTMTKNQTGQWVNGTMFNKWFDVKGDGKCAYLGDDGVATARCYTERKWICKKKKGT